MSRRAVAAFLLAEAAVYAAFLTIDLAGTPGPGVALKYAGILLCLIFSLCSARRGGDRTVFPALLLTAGADLLLLVMQRAYPLGVLLFLVVQSLYLIRLRLASRRVWWLLRAGTPLLLGAALFGLGAAEPLPLLAALYFSQLTVNTLIAWTLHGRRWRLFALGLTLFACCDVCVGLFNAPAFLPVPAPLYGFARVGMWLFYLPSQILIVLSALPEKGASHETL